AYTVSAFASARRVAGLFVTYIATSPEKEAVARRGLLDQVAQLRDAPVTAEELSRAKGYAIGTHAIRQQSGAAVVAEILDAWLLGSLSELDEYEESIRAVTAEEMRDVAARYFSEERLVEGIVRGQGGQRTASP
ncbi:MAG: M16 family metallopeptidase, partial [Gemmatimonadaceae bacterium]